MPNGSFGAQPTGADFGRVAGNASFATPVGFQVLVAEMPRRTNRIEMQDADPGALEGYAKRAAVRVQRASRGMLYEQAEAGALARPGWSSRLFG